MAATYCFEESKVKKTLAKCKKNDLAVIDCEGIPDEVIIAAVKRGVKIYGYMNAGALEKERNYYSKFKHIRLAKYDGWPGEYWVNVTNLEWQKHLVSEAKRLKKLGVIGLYFDNVDIYYMVKEGFEEVDTPMMADIPNGWLTFKALLNVITTITMDVGLTVMPNGGDRFVRALFSLGYGSLIKTVNQEGVLYSDFRATSKEDRKYFTEYLDWAKSEGLYVRGIEYCKRSDQISEAKEYYKRHGWNYCYISKHHNLEGD